MKETVKLKESQLRDIVRESIVSILSEKAKSKSQQRFFGMVDAYKKGELDDASPAVKKAAKGMTNKEVKDFAKTKHKGLPNHVDESKLGRIVRESINKTLKEGTTPGDLQEKWEMVKSTIGADQMLECIWNWAPENDIAQWLQWFEDEEWVDFGGM